MSDYGGSYGGGEFQSTYQGLGAYSGDEPPGGKNRRAIVVSVIVAVLLLAGAGATIYFLSQSEDDPQPVTKPAQTTSQTTSGATSQTPTETTTAEPKGNHLVDAIIAGWQGVYSAQDGAAYDVPKHWRIEAPSVISGFEGSSVRAHGLATYKPDACPEVDGSIRGRTGFSEPSSDDPAKAARTAAVRWTEAAASLKRGSGKVDTGPVEDVEIDGGKITAKVVTATAPGPKGECSSPEVQVTAAAFSSDGETVVFVVYRDKGVDDELDDGIAKTIVSSLRPFKPGD